MKDSAQPRVQLEYASGSTSAARMGGGYFWMPFVPAWFLSFLLMLEMQWLTTGSGPDSVMLLLQFGAMVIAAVGAVIAYFFYVRRRLTSAWVHVVAGIILGLSPVGLVYPLAFLVVTSLAL